MEWARFAFARIRALGLVGKGSWGKVYAIVGSIGFANFGMLRKGLYIYCLILLGFCTFVNSVSTVMVCADASNAK